MTDFLTDSYMDVLRASSPLGVGAGTPSPIRRQPRHRDHPLSAHMIVRATWDGCRPLSNDERRAEWSARFTAHPNAPQGARSYP